MNQAWFELFDDTHEQFHWVFTQYGFEREWNEMIRFRELKSKYQIQKILDKLWMDLPPKVFSPRGTMPGQEAFQTLIEE